MSARFEGKSAIVTGAGQGLGAAVAQRISADGGRVMVVDLDGDNAERVASELPGKAIGVQADVGSEADVERYTKLAVEQFGRLDCVHNNAGIIGAIALIPDISAEDFERTLWVNVRGTFFGTRAAMRAMGSAGGGAIVNTSSVMGLMGAKGVAPYVMTKHAIIGLTRCAAMEGATDGIRVNALCPGVVDTPMNRQSEAAAGEGDESKGREMLESTIAIGRYATPEEIANMATWLLSDEASYANGAIFTVDAGMTAGNDVLG
jgi:3alpha(or 20beta)-hydroxysteroid dehydrogenase